MVSVSRRTNPKASERVHRVIFTSRETNSVSLERRVHRPWPAYRCATPTPSPLPGVARARGGWMVAHVVPTSLPGSREAASDAAPSVRTLGYSDPPLREHGGGMKLCTPTGWNIMAIGGSHAGQNGSAVPTASVGAVIPVPCSFLGVIPMYIAVSMCAEGSVRGTLEIEICIRPHPRLDPEGTDRAHEGIRIELRALPLSISLPSQLMLSGHDCFIPRCSHRVYISVYFFYLSPIRQSSAGREGGGGNKSPDR